MEKDLLKKHHDYYHSFVKYKLDIPYEDIILEVSEYTSKPENELIDLFNGKTDGSKFCNVEENKISENILNSLYSRGHLGIMFELLKSPYKYGRFLRSISTMEFAKLWGKETVLDYGAGTGQELIFFSNNGFKCSYSDLKGGFSDFAEWRYKQRNLKIPIFDIMKLPDKRYDIVINYDVMEHIIDPLTAFANIFSHVTKDGFLFFSADWTEGSPDDYYHLRKNAVYHLFYRELIEKCGFRILSDEEYTDYNYLIFKKESDRSLNIETERKIFYDILKKETVKHLEKIVDQCIDKITISKTWFINCITATTLSRESLISELNRVKTESKMYLCR